jgi:hypothetical protein
MHAGKVYEVCYHVLGRPTQIRLPHVRVNAYSIRPASAINIPRGLQCMTFIPQPHTPFLSTLRVESTTHPKITTRLADHIVHENTYY